MKTKYLTLIGTAFALAMTSSVVFAQEQETPEIELSPEGMEILCERFPLNSRCSSDSASMDAPDASTEEAPTDDASGSLDRPAGPADAPPVDDTGTPADVTVPTDDSSDSITPSDGSLDRPAGPADAPPADDTSTPEDMLLDDSTAPAPGADPSADPSDTSTPDSVTTPSTDPSAVPSDGSTPDSMTTPSTDPITPEPGTTSPGT